MKYIFYFFLNIIILIYSSPFAFSKFDPSALNLSRLNFSKIDFSNSNFKKENIHNVVNYIIAYSENAVENMEKYGIPASITLGQGLLKKFSYDNNNKIFKDELEKIKNESYESIDENDNEDIYQFEKKYESRKKKNQEKMEKLMNNQDFISYREKSYDKLLTLNKKDYKGWAKGINNLGKEYEKNLGLDINTDLKYDKLLIDKIEKYLLWKFDNETISSLNNDKMNLHLESIMKKHIHINK